MAAAVPTLVSSTCNNRFERLPEELLGAIWCLLPVREALSSHHRVCKSLLLALTNCSAFWHRYYRYLCAVGEFATAPISRTNIAYVPSELLTAVVHADTSAHVWYRERCRQIKAADCLSWGNADNRCLGHGCGELGGQPRSLGPDQEAISRLLCSYNRVEELGSGFCGGPVRIAEGHEHHAAAIARDGAVVVWGHRACGLEAPDRSRLFDGERARHIDHPAAAPATKASFGARPRELDWLAGWLRDRQDWPVDVDAGHDIVLLRTAKHRLLLLESGRGYSGLRTWKSPCALADAACASWQPLALTADGAVTELLRLPDDRKLSIGQTHSSSECLGAGDPHDRFVQIVSGYDHVALLTLSGRLFVLGSTARHGFSHPQAGGELAGPATWMAGLRDGLAELRPASPHEISMPCGERCIAASCAASHTVVLAASGAVYTCGANTRGQLGLGHNESVPSCLHRVPLPGPAVAVSAGADYWEGGHTLILMADGSLRTCGSNRCGELGNRSQKPANGSVDAAVDGTEGNPTPSEYQTTATPVSWLERRGLQVLGVVAAENSESHRYIVSSGAAGSVYCLFATSAQSPGQW